ncbi:unnamed protein product [Schistosoma mattheei]|uniref:Uncharacterized protein n=1 Tax=Schistosoma mattheei TaxID=31246 RepID=A0A183PVA3_9TREM|nr:unnamed protein product [Schistosoma mattheei]
MSVLGLEENLQMVYRSDLGQMHDKGFQFQNVTNPLHSPYHTIHVKLLILP